MALVKAVLFDYGMVLSGEPDPSAWAQLLTITGLSEELLHREYWAHRHAYDRGDLHSHSFWHAVGQHAGLILDAAQVAALIAADNDLWTQPNPPMIHWAQQLQRAGIRTGILSNMPDAMETGLRARHPWIESFDHHTWSHAVNRAKPEPEIYRHAAEGLQTPPEHILFLDDKSENITAALAEGMQAIQYSSHAGFEREMQARGLDYLLQLERHTDSQNGKL